VVRLSPEERGGLEAMIRKGTDKLTGLRRTLTIADAGNADSKENGDAVEDHD
jgi:hypothetical protein